MNHSLVKQLARFTVVGLICTLSYSVLFLELREVMPAQLANLLAALFAAIANTTLNRRITFGIRGAQGAWRHQAQGLVIFVLGVGFTSAALMVLDWVQTGPSATLELAVLTVANLVATAMRFLLLRSWVFRRVYVL
jgi:putative flippase GtrA